MADLAIAPFVRQFAHTDIDWFQQQDWPQVWRWLQDFLQSIRFAKIMHKYEPWKEGMLSLSFLRKHARRIWVCYQRVKMMLDIHAGGNAIKASVYMGDFTGNTRG